MMRPAIAIAFVLSIIACKSSGPNPGDDDDDDIDSGVAADARVTEDGWTELIARDWTVPPGSADTYKCRRIQIPSDMMVTGFRAIAPLGTHHTVVTISNSGAIGDYDCSASNLDYQMLYASGVGTDTLAFPTGVAMKIKAGQYINLNLHLFNATDDPIDGHSGIEVKVVPAAGKNSSRSSARRRWAARLSRDCESRQCACHRRNNGPDVRQSRDR